MIPSRLLHDCSNWTSVQLRFGELLIERLQFRVRCIVNCLTLCISLLSVDQWLERCKSFCNSVLNHLGNCGCIEATALPDRRYVCTILLSLVQEEVNSIEWIRLPCRHEPQTACAIFDSQSE